MSSDEWSVYPSVLLDNSSKLGRSIRLEKAINDAFFSNWWLRHNLTQMCVYILLFNSLQFCTKFAFNIESFMAVRFSAALGVSYEIPFCLFLKHTLFS